MVINGLAAIRSGIINTVSRFGRRKTEMAEDPAYAERHGVPVAVDHYFDKLLQGAANILQCLFDNNSGAALSVLQNFTARPPF